MGEKGIIKLWILIGFLIIIIASITLFGIWYYYSYEIQYKNGDTYYLINDGKEISQKIIKIVDEKLHEEVKKADTKMITIKGLTSGNTLNISNQETILKILNEFIYAKDAVMTEELYDT